MNVANLIAFSILSVSEEIIMVLNSLPIHDNPREAICRILKECRSTYNIGGYYICVGKENKPVITVELDFTYYSDRIILKFHDKDDSRKNYTASLCGFSIVVSKPIGKLFVEGIDYCDNHHRILYVDSFSKRAPLLKTDYLLTTDYIEKKGNDAIKIHEKKRFFEFKEMLEGNNDIRILNLNFDDLREGYDEGEYWLNDMIEKQSISCVCCPSEHKQIITSIVPTNILVIGQDDNPPKLGMNDWLNRVLLMFERNYMYRENEWNELAVSIRRFMIDYNISNNVIRDSCKRVFGPKQFEIILRLGINY